MKCQGHGTLLSVFGLGRIAHDLYQKYPGLARDFLQIDVDTGQVVSLDEFVTAYNKGAFATRLDTAFLFRNDEIQKALTSLESEHIVLIVGHAGVGKTRFALECCRRYADMHPDAEVFCIFNRGADLFQDLRARFRPPGHYVILVDDTNRVSGFKYVLQLLHDQRSDQRIKIVATVRDYAKQSTLDAVQPYSSGSSIELTPLADEQISQLVQSEFQIQHPLYLERITDVAKGNPRIAVMAACVANKEKRLDSISDVSALYDEYFKSIRDDLSEFGDATLLQVAGLISFFRVVDRSNAELMGAINDAFKLNPDQFWVSAHRLHELEAVDMYEDEVVRVSDQVLATYLFYLSVFRERTLSFATLLEYFFPRFRYRFVDAINSVLSAFDTKSVIESLRSDIDHAWSLIQERGSEEDLRNFIDVFWFLKQTDALLYVRDSIQSLQYEPRVLGELTFEPSSQPVPPATLLSILDNFRYGDEPNLQVALTLLIDYLKKRPADLRLILRMLTERYGIDRFSHLNGFRVERAVIDVLWQRAQSGADEFVSRLFLTVAEFFLHTHFQTHESKKDSVVTIYQFDVTNTEELLGLRKIIWVAVFALHSVPTLSDAVLEVVQKHSHGMHHSASRGVILNDSVYVQEFFRSSLDPQLYHDCVIVHDYLEVVRRVGVEADEDLSTRFTNETYALSRLLFDDRAERVELGWQESEKVRRERLADYAEDFTARDFDLLLGCSREILSQSTRGGEEYRVQFGVGDILVNLAERDPGLYDTVLDRYLQTGNSLGLGPWALVAKLIEVSGSNRAYEIVSKGDYPGRRVWLFGYFMSLPREAISLEHMQEVYELYKNAPVQELPRDMDYLLRFTPVDARVVVTITRTLVERAGSDPNVGHALSGMFSSHSQISERIAEVFEGEIFLLKQAYFAACAVEHHTDYDNQVFNTLLDMDPTFAGEYVSWKTQGEQWISRYDDSRDYSFIWRRDDYATAMMSIIDAVRAARDQHTAFFSYLEVFFITRGGDTDIEVLHDRQDAFLDELIEHRSTDHDLMQLLFGVICNQTVDRRRRRILTFLRHNQDFEAFKTLSLESNSWGWTGSAVPMLQGRVDFFESLLTLLNRVELLQHKQRIEQQIQYLREDIEREKKKDFMTD